jgi:three-Cys-motif partner protein
VNEPDLYEGREQTAAKHFILKRYLEALVYKLLHSGFPSVTYVDGFCGPWNARAPDLSDTSFMIALRVLKEAHEYFLDQGNPKEIRCLFVESKPKPFARLRDAVSPSNSTSQRFIVDTFHGEFTDAIPRALQLCSNSFALTFIDPTGWTGYSFDKTAPLLQRDRSEVIINFMYNHINRFAASSDPSIVAQFSPA